MIYIWLGVLLLSLILEGATAAITSLWFAIGALAAMLTTALGGEIWLQITVFTVVSILCLLALRPVLKKYITPKQVKTNIDAIIGSAGVVQETVDNLAGTGKVKLSGMEWTARSETGEIIEKGAVVTVVRIEGVKVFVNVK